MLAWLAVGSRAAPRRGQGPAAGRGWGRDWRGGAPLELPDLVLLSLSSHGTVPTSTRSGEEPHQRWTCTCAFNLGCCCRPRLINEDAEPREGLMKQQGPDSIPGPTRAAVLTLTALCAF